MPHEIPEPAHKDGLKKRIILCCDGTWFDSDDGFNKATLKNEATLQIINYESGVGTGSNTIDTLTGGAFGLGLTQRVREAYAFLCANYTDGDEIILIGWSRGAFTVRSVAGIISNLGLLTREGMDSFVPVFKDMQHWKDMDYQDPLPNIPFSNKPKGDNAADIYRQRLEDLGLTRVTQQTTGELIKVKAIGVWDTVGSLGIPRIGWLDTLGIRAKNKDWHDTDLSDRIEHAFHALALDESRSPYTPSLWERRPANKSTTDLRQVWFPGTHGNCGGGADDVGMANITLAWMIDQMASIGVEFYAPSALRMIAQQVNQYEAKAVQIASKGGKEPRQWAADPIYQANKPVRPWGMGAIEKAPSFVDWITGSTPRTPGQYHQVDRDTGDDRHGPFLIDTNERIHSSVRIRLACRGLGVNDKAEWTAPTLANWQLRRTTAQYEDPVPFDPLWDPAKHKAVIQALAANKVRDECGRKPNDDAGERWIWEYAGPEKDAPTDKKQRIMVEEPLGPYERFLLNQVGGYPNVYLFAENKEMRNEPLKKRKYVSRQDSETETE